MQEGAVVAVGTNVNAKGADRIYAKEQSICTEATTSHGRRGGVFGGGLGDAIDGGVLGLNESKVNFLCF